MDFRLSLHHIKDYKFEWDPLAFGLLSIPLALIGVLLFCFSDLIYKLWESYINGSMKPNYEFEENIEYKDPSKITIRILKIIGIALILFGIYLFWAAEDFYNFWFT